MRVSTTLLAHEGHASARRFFTADTAPGYNTVSLVATFGMDRAWKKRIVEIAGRRDNVLDLASGTGILSSMLSAAGVSVTGLDLTFEYLERSSPNSMCQGTAEVLPFRDGMFDAVVSSYLAKYVDARLAVDECWRVLEPGGIAIFHDFACPTGAMRGLWNAHFAILRFAGMFSKSWRPVFAELDKVICQSRWVDKFSEAMRERGISRHGHRLPDARHVGDSMGVQALSGTRINEWFVPSFGPPKFRAFVGMMFLPYTGMCVSFAVIGSVMVQDVHWDRVGAIALIYALALGVGAHAADTIGSKKAKPWGSYFTRRQMLALMASSLAVAYAIGIYYIVLYVPLLAIVAVLEGLFLLAYNFEIWGGRFHNDFWFALSWGALPVMAGYLIQTNDISVLPFAVAGAAALASFAEIKMSRPYKQLKKSGADPVGAAKLERRLKALSLSTIAFSLVLVAVRLLL